MGRTGSYVVAAVFGLLCILSGLRALELLFFGGLSSHNTGRIVGSVVISLLCGAGAKKFLDKARAPAATP